MFFFLFRDSSLVETKTEREPRRRSKTSWSSRGIEVLPVTDTGPIQRRGPVSHWSTSTPSGTLSSPGPSVSLECRRVVSTPRWWDAPLGRTGLRRKCHTPKDLWSTGRVGCLPLRTNSLDRNFSYFLFYYSEVLVQCWHKWQTEEKTSRNRTLGREAVPLRPSHTTTLSFTPNPVFFLWDERCTQMMRGELKEGSEHVRVHTREEVPSPEWKE